MFGKHVYAEKCSESSSLSLSAMKKYRITIRMQPYVAEVEAETLKLAIREVEDFYASRLEEEAYFYMEDPEVEELESPSN